MRDRDARVATVLVDLFFRELQRACDTSASTVHISRSHPVSDDVDDWHILTEEEDEQIRATAEEEAYQAEEEAFDAEEEIPDTSDPDLADVGAEDGQLTDQERSSITVAAP